MHTEDKVQCKRILDQELDSKQNFELKYNFGKLEHKVKYSI